MLYGDHPSENRPSTTSIDQFYAPEHLLSGWISLSVLMLTTSMLFYHLTRRYSIKTNKMLAAAVAISLMVCGGVYLIVSLFNYIPRMDEVLETCEKEDLCSNDKYQRIKTSKNLNVAMVGITIGIELLIAYLIFNTI